MRILKLSFWALLFLLTFLSKPASAAVMLKVNTPTTESTKPPQEQKLQARLAQIEAIDKSDLSFSEKRQLRKEKRSLKKQLANNSGGVYISIGSLLIVIILLILLL